MNPAYVCTCKREHSTLPQVRTKENSILAFAEGRVYSCDDHGTVDLVVKRSVDNGKSWGPLQGVRATACFCQGWLSDLVVLAVVHSDRSGNHTIGNPAPIADAVSGGTLAVDRCSCSCHTARFGGQVEYGYHSVVTTRPSSSAILTMMV